MIYQIKVGLNMTIALMADEDTVNFFRIGGLEQVFVVNEPENIEESLEDLLKMEDITILLITDTITEKNREVINQVIETHEFPIILSIPTLGSTVQVGTDTITELILRKLGIELK